MIARLIRTRMTRPTIAQNVVITVKARRQKPQPTQENSGEVLDKMQVNGPER